MANAFADQLVGQTIEAAQRLCRENGYNLRVLDVPAIVTTGSYVPGHVTVQVHKGMVKKAHEG